MDIISDAVRFAAGAFSGRRRKFGGAAIIHSLEVATIAATMTNDDEIIAAAVLHDTVEDVGVPLDELKKLFGERVAFLVECESENKRRDKPADETWKLRKQEAIDILRASTDEGVKIVFLSDKLSNMRSLKLELQRVGGAVWERFNQKDPELHHWYYRAVADALSELSYQPAWREYDGLVREVFETE